MIDGLKIRLRRIISSSKAYRFLDERKIGCNPLYILAYRFIDALDRYNRSLNNICCYLCTCGYIDIQ